MTKKLDKSANISSVKDFLSFLESKNKVKLTKYDKKKLVQEFEELHRPTVPVDIFRERLSPFEALVKYLAENRNFGYSEIGRHLKKERQVVWSTYRRASKKLRRRFPDKGRLAIPLAIFSSESLSVSELLVRHLKETAGMRNSEIADILKKDSSTIWTLYNRAKEKGGAP